MLMTELGLLLFDLCLLPLGFLEPLRRLGEAVPGVGLSGGNFNAPALKIKLLKAKQKGKVDKGMYYQSHI